MAEQSTAAEATRRPRHRWPYWVAGLAAVPLAAFGLSLALTPALEAPPAEAGPPLAPTEAEAERAAEAEGRARALAWPVEPLEGEPAKRLLLETVRAARDRLGATEGYTATFLRRERVDGALGPPQTIRMKVRHRPFSVYFRFVEPDAGKEVVYCEGRYDDHVMAHPGGLARALLPVLKVAPDSKLALSGNRHPITEAGLLNMAERLVAFRELDLEDPDAVTILDTIADDRGRARLRSIHKHPHHKPERPFAYIEILYDPETRLPTKITSFDWPEPGDEGELKLAEQYEYEDLVLDPPLTDLDFDPANPAYEFRRF